MIDFVTLRSRIRPAEQRALLDYWLRIRGDRPAPARADVRPEEIGAAVLPHVGLVDVLEGGARFRYRLVGTAMNRLYRRDYTGTFVDVAKAPDYAGVLLREYRRCAVYRTVRYFEAPSRFANDHRRPTYRLLLPLASDGGAVDMILFSTIADASEHLPVRLREQLGGDAVVAIEDYTVHSVTLAPSRP